MLPRKLPQCCRNSAQLRRGALTPRARPQVMPGFSQDEFLAHVGKELAPQVIGAYLKADDAVLRLSLIHI